MDINKVVAYLDKEARKNKFKYFELFTSVSDRIESKSATGTVIIKLLVLAENGEFR